MKHVKFFWLLLALLPGCAYNQYQTDIADNQYQEKQIHADANAVYVGEWTAASNVGIRSLKIREDGRIKVCLAPSSGTNEGKVYLENGTPAIIIKTGAKVKIISAGKESLLLDVYGKQEKYHAGLVDDACVSAFKNFE